ncbi:hypothetical protein HanHA300_Chr11g0404371 [Helianthus annuus]|nr:hypothetical protein HanHA300_Chr11g0404371 [Helianthus annuus]KAJ0509629.1 hypothetical protein HanIR_Chr11g0531141 [Helianthus annuus]KAJ0517657.1 hypothetical protein HanHA89_Chr11g0428021 [Helianthus annuus]KAJ0685674.1 hypothetical protein HanLR1_Chr11g0405531 [Helianthus annuus]KAJ0689555.1 hypothetical protein HanOQP8_Chr11g0407211 [Helianthus annuus]
MAGLECLIIYFYNIMFSCFHIIAHEFVGMPSYVTYHHFMLEFVYTLSIVVGVFFGFWVL